MTTPLGQLAEPHLCFPSRGCGVQLFCDRPVSNERLSRVTRRQPGPPGVRKKLGAEERVQSGRGGCLVRRRRVLGPERILVRRAEQAVRLRSKVFVGLGRRPLEHLDRLLGLALREPGLCEQDAGLLGPMGPGKVLHHLGKYAGGERVVLRVEREAPLSDLATGASLRRLVIPDPVGERLQPVGLSNHRASCRRYRRCHTPSSGGCRGGWKLVEVGGGWWRSIDVSLHHPPQPPQPSSTCFRSCPWGDSNTRPTV